MSAPARPSLIDRVWEYAEESGKDSRDVYVELLCQISFASPEVVDAAFAKLRGWDAAASQPDLPGTSVSCAKAKM